MAVLKIEVDTADLCYDEESMSFDELINESLYEKVKEHVIESFSKSAFNATAKNISLEVIHQVTKKLYSLVNEEIVMQDRWGKPTFIGTVEDYIKQQIDNKLLKHVNTNGEPLVGCSTNKDYDTWIEYTVKKHIEDSMKFILRDVEKNVNLFCKKELDKHLESFKKNTLNRIIMERLEAVGLAKD